jgi:putative heme-binding domain-containing protein
MRRVLPPLCLVGSLRLLLSLLMGLWLAASICAADDAPARVEWTGSRITGAPVPPPPYGHEPVLPALRFDKPTELVRVPGSDRMMITEEKGKVFSFPMRPASHGDGYEDVATADLVCDLGVLEGLDHVFGLAFHPRFAENRQCFIVYALQPKLADGTRVSRFTVSTTDPPTIDLASEERILDWVSGGHNGSSLQFGPDGMLYIATGDSQDATPPDALGTGQSIDDLLASVLRIDVDRRPEPTAEGQPARPYSIPVDNPFVDVPGARGEVWAYGLRNPWRMCFDDSGRLWAADVGWELWEMIYLVERGGNYGWSIMEGPQPVVGDRRRGPDPITPPVISHPHTESRSITGGYVSTTPRLPELAGAYVYGDYVTGKVWGLRHDGTRISWQQELADTPLALSTFGLGADGEVLMVDYDSGSLHRLVRRPPVEANVLFPTRLSETGLFADTAAQAPAPGVVPYDVSAEAWADGTTAERWLALPGKAQLSLYEAQNPQQGFIRGKFKFPTDGVLAKTIAIETSPGVMRRIETQLLHFNGADWCAYSYLWNDDQTDAELVGPEGAAVRLEIADVGDPGVFHRQSYRVASRTECLMCHTTRGGSLYGFTPAQLNRPVDPRAVLTGLGSPDDNQLRCFNGLGLLAKPLDESVTPPVDPYDTTADLDRRARSYLQMNCAQCHLRGGGGASDFDVRADVALDRTKLLGLRPSHGTFALDDAAVVTAGDPTRSVLYYRMATLGRGRMPHFGSTVVDARGLKLIGDWIAALPTDAAAATQGTLAADQPPATASPSKALGVLRAIDGGTFPPEVMARMVAWGTSHGDPQFRDLFERFIPEEHRRERLGTSIRAVDLLALEGDADRGRRLWESASLGCRSCHHPASDQATDRPAIGPDLAGIGKRLTRAEILESLLEPSRKVDPKFATWYAETKDGLVHTGLLVERSETDIVIRDAQGRDTRIPRGEVEQFVQQPQSLMPEQLLRDLSAAEAADLLAYLGGL